MIYLYKFLILMCAFLYICSCEQLPIEPIKETKKTQSKSKPKITKTKTLSKAKPSVLTKQSQKSVEFSDDKIIDKDLAHNLFQVRVINQAPNECTGHRERNLLFMLDILESPQNELDEKYERMLDDNLYEKMMSNAVCILEHPDDFTDIKMKKPKAGTKRIRRAPDLKKLVDENPDFSTYLPAKSRAYLANITEYKRYVNESFYKKSEDFNKKNIRIFEPEEINSDDVARDTAILTPRTSGRLDNNADLLNLARLINSDEDLALPLAIGLNSVGVVGHAVSIVVERKAQKLKFYFMDPLNWKFSHTDSYKKALYPLMRFFEDKDYFKKSLIRSGYLSAYEFIEDKRKAGEINSSYWKEFLFFPFFDYLEILEKLNLLNDEFFKKYYKTPTCKLMKEVLDNNIEITTKRGVFGNHVDTKHPRARSELLKKFACNN